MFVFQTTGFPTNTITETGTLPAGMSFVDKHNGTAQLTGTPNITSGGTYTLTITAANGVSPAATQVFSIQVYGEPTITSSASTSFQVGTAGSFGITTTGYPAPAFTETGALPTGVSFVDNGDGTATLAGTPAGGQQGVYPISIDAGNFIGSDSIQDFTLTVGLAPTINSANNSTFTTGSVKTFSVTTTGYPTAVTLSETGSLPSGLTFIDNGNGTASLAGTPGATAGGVYVITISGVNGFGPNASQTFTLTVDQVPAVTSATATNFLANTAEDFEVTTTGYPTISITESGALPTGVSFTDNGNGTADVLGTPTTDGLYVVTFTAGNGVGSDAVQVFDLAVDQAPAITSGASTTFVTGTPGNVSVTTTGYPTATITETGALPSGVSFTDNGNGSAALAGTPAAGTGGTYSFTIGAANGIGTAASQVFTLTVNQAPAITTVSNPTFTVGTLGTASFTATGFPVVSITETGALPSGLTYTDLGNGTAELTGTPGAGTGNNYTFTLTAGNGVGSNASHIYTLTVDQAPAIDSAATDTFTVGTVGTFNVTTTGFPTHVTLTDTGSLPTGLTFTDNGNGSAMVTGTPAAGTGGTYVLTFTGNNGIGTPATQTFTLTVDDVPAIQTVSNPTFTVGTAGTFTVDASGFPFVTLTETGTLPSGLTWTDQGNDTGTLTGTPAAGTGGNDTFTITAHNGLGSDATQVYTLTVDQAPAVTSSASGLFTVGSVGTVNFTTSGFPTHVTLSETGTLPSGLTFTDNGNGTGMLTGTPVATTGGTYVLTIGGTNGIGTAATQVFTLTVDEAASITSANTESLLVGSNNLFVVHTLGYPLPTVSYTGTLPSGVTFTSNGNGGAVLSGTPAAATGGTYVLTLTAHNGIGSDGTQTFTLTINETPSVTSADHAGFVLGSAGSATIQALGFPFVTLTETGALPTGVSFVDNGNDTATLAGTPAGGTSGAYTITIGASNFVNSASQVFTLSVGQAPSFSSGNSTTFTNGSAGTFTVAATGFPAATLSETGTLPSGVSFNNATGVLAGTPSGTPGTYVITFGATNTIGSATPQVFTVTVDQAPAITSGTASSFLVNTVETFNVITTGYPAASISETGSLPTGVSLVDNGNGSANLEGTPTVDGDYMITITAGNGVGSNATQVFQLAVGQAASITSMNNTSFVAGSSTAFTITTAGSPTPSLSETGSLPAGLTFTDNGDGTATLGGMPVALTGGTYMLTITAANGIGSATNQTFTLSVDQMPVFSSGTTTTLQVGTAGTFPIAVSGYPVAAISESGVLPSGVSFTDNGNDSAILSGTPATGTGGTYVITFSSDNSVGTEASQVFSLVIDDGAQITSADSATFTSGTHGSFTVTTTSVPTASITETGTIPAGLVLSDNGDGTATLVGTPGALAAGTYVFTINASNGVGTTAYQTFTLTVDHAPAFSSGTATTFQVGTAGTFGVTALAYPAASFSETGSLPSGVSLQDNGDGTATLTGTPAGTGGTYVVTFTAGNSIGTNGTQVFTLTLDKAPSVTSEASGTFTVGTVGTFNLTSAGFPAATFSETGTLPSGLSLVNTGNGTANLVGTPGAGTSGTYTITIGAANGITPNASQVFTLTVDQAPAITSASSATFNASPEPVVLFTTQDDFSQWGNSGSVGTSAQSTPDSDGSTTNGLGNTTAAGQTASVGAGSMAVSFNTGTYDYFYGPGEQSNTAFLSARWARRERCWLITRRPRTMGAVTSSWA